MHGEEEMRSQMNTQSILVMTRYIYKLLFTSKNKRRKSYAPILSILPSIFRVFSWGIAFCISFSSAFNVTKLVPRSRVHIEIHIYTVLLTAQMHRKLMAIINSNHCHLFYQYKKKERERKALRSLAKKLLVWPRRCDLRRLQTQ